GRLTQSHKLASDLGEFGERRVASLKTCFSRRPVRVRGEAHQSLPVNWNDHAWPVSLCALGTLPANAATREVARRTVREMLQLRDIGKTRRAFLLVDATVAAIALLYTNNMSAAGQ